PLPLLRGRDQLRERDLRQIRVDVLVESGPQVVGHAAPVLVTVLLAAAHRRVDRLVDGVDDVRDADRRRIAGERVASAGAAYALDEPTPAQLAEELLEIRQRDVLAVGNAGERHRS